MKLKGVGKEKKGKVRKDSLMVKERKPDKTVFGCDTSWETLVLVASRYFSPMYVLAVVMTSFRASKVG